MGEGLSPIEAGKQMHEHGAAEHENADEATKTHASGENDRRSRIAQICEALLLALVTITAAWAGYSAARWSTASRVEIARSSTLRNFASRADLEALSLRNFDSSTFNTWFIAYTLNNPQKEAVAVRRFRPVFKVAFDAWLATNPLHNPHSPPGPTYMPQYRLPQQAKANALDKKAAVNYDTGTRAGSTADDYVRITVFLAAVLFLVGIGSTFKLHGVRYALIGFGSALLVLSVVLLAQQPGLPHLSGRAGRGAERGRYPVTCGADVTVRDHGELAGILDASPGGRCSDPLPLVRSRTQPLSTMRCRG